MAMLHKSSALVEARASVQILARALVFSKIFHIQRVKQQRRREMGTTQGKWQRKRAVVAIMARLEGEKTVVKSVEGQFWFLPSDTRRRELLCESFNFCSTRSSRLFIIFRILLFLVAVVSVIFSLLVIGTCDFIEFLVEVPDQNGTTSLTAFSFGQFRYDVNNTGCKSIDDADLPIDWTIWTGRCSTAAAGVCATLACILIVVEFLCCRFNFSRCLLSTLFAIGILGMACAFFMFTSSIWYV